MPLTPEGPLTRQALGAVLLYQSLTFTYQAYGTLNSSPWTITNVGADAAKVRSMREHVAHAAFNSLAAAAFSTWLAQSWWPMVAAIAANAYLIVIYERAVRHGQAEGSTGQGWFGTWG